MTIREEIIQSVQNAVESLYGNEAAVEFSVNRPEQRDHGDYASNVAMVLAKQLKRKPLEIAEEIKEQIVDSRWQIAVAPPGFLNVTLAREIVTKNLEKVLEEGQEYGRTTSLEGKKVMVEYTDPNPFKEFHIGHLMTNAIGESLARVTAFSGANVQRVNYQGDVGIHVAKAVWAMKGSMQKEYADARSWDILKKVNFLAKAYAFGNSEYESNEDAKKEIQEINKQIFANDPEIMELYEEGKSWSLEYFEEIYKLLGTNFDDYYFESQVWELGKQLVEEGLSKGVFEKSDGAVVYHGEEEGLHTRVFINSEGIPTYEAKELGLALTKNERYPFDAAYVVTANEITEYYKVTLAALSKFYPEFAAKIQHVPHGMMKFKGGKMSSRTGKVITAMQFISDVKEMVRQKIKEGSEFSQDTKEHIAEVVALGAIKYSILRQSIGKDIIFDFETALSFEGDSGPYLQYTHARACSILRKANESGVVASSNHPDDQTRDIESLLLEFSEAVDLADKYHDSHYIATYLIQFAKAFNNFYGRERIVDANNAGYRVAVTQAVAIVLRSGLNLLGIQAPEEM